MEYHQTAVFFINRIYSIASVYFSKKINFLVLFYGEIYIVIDRVYFLDVVARYEKVKRDIKVIEVIMHSSRAEYIRCGIIHCLR